MSQCAYDLPTEECIELLCGYIESLITLKTNGYGTPNQVSDPGTVSSSSSSTPTCRRSLDYIAERSDGEVHPVQATGEEFCVGIGYDDIDLKVQRKRLMRRFISKTIPQIPLFDYLQR